MNSAMVPVVASAVAVFLSLAISYWYYKK
jgi:hypothetical protein